ncbi:MBL fold metallo-hydrolase [Varunaivibrio sulfuroxidans]|uniref:Phosphoribosyl 1,2-cyclic phosphate phosphodiesterase n=1 Tax=Varunaivibrio sulfuroxidans TaxID=1773489 RepID=A0A4R3JFU6_9PROT|nr:MBL fold metallo-hydrolase [Varunaivibrio sulfuroxidans]TCS64365.1 phosphoribosyl 1,2-cyclic phosphate phosphodiesterase [Varunaivibrio sulfuroxidans]WES31202.1 MBL fold metallo-hydrolase [Varunaivibrio sulfuroxidans]
MRVTILGCGASSGTPSIEAGWGRCDSNEPKNRRLRPSILVQSAATSILVDTSPDLRQQLLNANVKSLDGVVFTHAHADHLHGIDDLRGINRLMNANISAYGDAATFTAIRQRFDYILEPLSQGAQFYYKPTLTEHRIVNGETFHIGPIAVTCFEQNHGYGHTLGFRFDNFAYSTDLMALPDEAFDLLVGVKTWVIGAFTDHKHPTHASVDQALEWIDRVKPERAVLTHMSPRLDYRTLRSSLPDNVLPAYDGMVLDIP